MDRAKQRLIERKKRARRVRKSIKGTVERPRLCIRRSLNHISAQIVNDVEHTSLIQVSSTCKEVKQRIGDKKTKTEISKILGEVVAEKALEKGIQAVVFDRKGYSFHGRVKALAEAAREKGLKL